MEESQRKFDHAKEILKLDGISADLKAAAEAVLLEALQQGFSSMITLVYRGNSSLNIN